VSKFEVQLDDDLDLRIVRVVEPVTYEEVIDLVAREFEGRQTLNLIWDFAPGTLQLLSMDELKLLLTARLDRVRERVGGHTVMIAHDPSELTLMKWYKEYAETLGVKEVKFHIAESLEVALGFVRS
jgi:hypothetical protein